jgi:YVTN family beta-propeller protein
MKSRPLSKSIHIRAQMSIALLIFLVLTLDFSAASDAASHHALTQFRVTNTDTHGTLGASSRQPIAYVSDSVDGTLIPIFLNTLKVGVPISVGSDPEGVALTPDGSKAYVVHEDSSTISPVILRSRTVLPDIPARPLWSEEIAISPDGREGWVNGGNVLTPINLATDSPGRQIAYLGAWGFAITPDGKWLYDANGGSDVTEPVNLRTGAIEPGIVVGPNPQGIAITPDGRTAYIADTGGDTATPFDITERRALRPISVGGAPFGVAISPSGRFAYVASRANGTVSVIRTSTNTVTRVVKVGALPQGVAVAPGGRRVVVVNTGDGTVSVIDTVTWRVATLRIADHATNSDYYLGPNVAITPDQSPHARFSVDPGWSESGRRFDASASTAYFGTVVWYRWSFGDGTSTLTRDSVVSHVFPKPGRYRVVLTVTDSDGTSVGKVYTGQTMSRHGGSAARDAHNVVV